MRTVSRLQLQTWLAAGEPVTLVDALPADVFAAGHLPGATNLPLDRLPADAPAALPDRAARIVTYCANAECPASRLAAEALAALGYTNVHEFTGGKRAWQMAGNELTR